jgi:hypothetical protein
MAWRQPSPSSPAPFGAPLGRFQGLTAASGQAESFLLWMQQIGRRLRAGFLPKPTLSDRSRLGFYRLGRLNRYRRFGITPVVLGLYLADESSVEGCSRIRLFASGLVLALRVRAAMEFMTFFAHGVGAPETYPTVFVVEDQFALKTLLDQF